MDKSQLLMEYIKARYQTITIPVTGYNVPDGTEMEWIKDEWTLTLEDIYAVGYTKFEIEKFAIKCIKSELLWQIMQSYNM